MGIGSDAMGMPCSFSMTEKKHIVFLGIGSNLGDKEENIGEAVRRIQRSVGKVVKLSTLFYSKPWGFDSPNDFVNVVARCCTTLTPKRLLKETQKIECDMGRTTKSVNAQYHDRIIDIDILLYDDLHIDYPELQIPHPLMMERDFVVIPLKEVLD